ncbi:MAG: tRNA epoxyqueuosine(34) reductase QueG [Clostridiales bacterium]|jgi:epoxyqueuosine reductase|nr:tRNA epoxyqueuosine(34) reductase QueG [Clostridiales bacterium]
MKAVIEEIREFASEKGIIWGVCDGAPLSFAEKFARIDTPFVDFSFEERTCPEKTMKSVKSIIVVGGFYGAAPNAPSDGKGRCSLSSGMAGEDYHVVMRGLLKELEGRIARRATFASAIFVDNGPLMERALALKSGLGFFGKNSFVINRGRGSFFNIGYMMTNLELPATSPESAGFELCEKTCGDNPLCEKACPGKALNSKNTPVMDFKKCVSYLTQKKEPLDARESAMIGSRLMGCDVCQRVCPFNAGVEKDYENEFFPLISDILEMTNASFNRRFKRTAAGWRGKKTFARNALIALNNLNDADE